MSRRPSRATRPVGGGLRRNRLAVQLTFELRGQVSDRFAQLHPGFDVPVVSREVQLDGEILQGCDRRESWSVAGGLGLERGQGRGHRDFEVVKLDVVSGLRGRGCLRGERVEVAEELGSVEAADIH